MIELLNFIGGALIGLAIGWWVLDEMDRPLPPPHSSIMPKPWKPYAMNWRKVHGRGV